MPKYEVSVNVPTAGEVDLEVHGVGLVKNGSSTVVEMSKEDATRLKETEGIEIKSTKADPPETKEGGDK